MLTSNLKICLFLFRNNADHKHNYRNYEKKHLIFWLPA